MANHREVTDSEDHIHIDCLLPTTYSGVVLVRVITVEYEEIEKIRGHLYFRGKLDREHCYIRDLTNHYTAAENERICTALKKDMCTLLGSWNKGW